VTGGVREALHNVVRHARGADATVRLSAEGPVVVEVTDDGPGFDVERIGAHSRGITQSLQARMSRVGGRATVTSSPGNGTSVRLEWPGPGSRGAGLPGAGCGGVGTPEAESIGG